MLCYVCARLPPDLRNTFSYNSLDILHRSRYRLPILFHCNCIIISSALAHYFNLGRYCFCLTCITVQCSRSSFSFPLLVITFPSLVCLPTFIFFISSVVVPVSLPSPWCAHFYSFHFIASVSVFRAVLYPSSFFSSKAFVFVSCSHHRHHSNFQCQCPFPSSPSSSIFLSPTSAQLSTTSSLNALLAARHPLLFPLFSLPFFFPFSLAPPFSFLPSHYCPAFTYLR